MYVRVCGACVVSNGGGVSRDTHLFRVVRTDVPDSQRLVTGARDQTSGYRGAQSEAGDGAAVHMRAEQWRILPNV